MNKVDAKIKIGFAISSKRQAKGLTQQELANITNLSRNYISDLENGRYTPSLNALSRLALVLDIDLNFLTALTEIQVEKEAT